jgi:hypothetical protein
VRTNDRVQPLTGATEEGKRTNNRGGIAAHVAGVRSRSVPQSVGFHGAIRRFELGGIAVRRWARGDATSEQAVDQVGVRQRMHSAGPHRFIARCLSDRASVLLHSSSAAGVCDALPKFQNRRAAAAEHEAIRRWERASCTTTNDNGSEGGEKLEQRHVIEPLAPLPVSTPPTVGLSVCSFVQQRARARPFRRRSLDDSSGHRTASGCDGATTAGLRQTDVDHGTKHSSSSRRRSPEAAHSSTSHGDPR